MENPSPRSDAIEVDTNSAGIRHDRSGVDDLIDTASGPPTPSVLHRRNQGAHANMDDSENEDHDWPSDQTIEEDRQKEVQHTKYANIFIFTFLLQNTEYQHPN